MIAKDCEVDPSMELKHKMKSERVGSVHIYIYTGPELGATAVRSKVRVQRSPALQWPLSPGRLCLWAPVPLSAKHYTFSASWLGRGGPWWGVNLEYRPPK